ncbi:chemotaxis protein CheW [Neobacillus sp. LXY-1]|uniref:chemotaxis protein CheW n=1 Tax=Neobacillus sp. LXY-1 TaxID=3379133 RepID=UPI003EDEB178
MKDFKALVFKIGQEEYAVHINQVISIERMQEMTPYPNRLPHVVGVATIREVVTPIVDLRAALTGIKTDLLDEARIIVVQVEGNEVGLIVDAATDVLDIPSETVQHPNLLETRDVSYLIGISKLADRLLILLDINKLLNETTNLEELNQIKNLI